MRRPPARKSPEERKSESIDLFAQAKAARTAGDLRKARTALRAAKKADPQRRVVRRALGEVAAELGDDKEALQELLAYRRLTGDHRHDPMIADCYTRQGRPARALEFLAPLGPADLPPPIYAEVLVARARAQAAAGRGSQAVAMLTRALRDASVPQRPLLAGVIAELRAAAE